MAQFAIDEVLTTGIQISGFIFDYSNRLGTAGQVLTSTTSGVMWQADSSISDLSSLSGQIAATGTLLNNRINSLSGYVNQTFISGSGVTNYVPRWNGAKLLVTGNLYDNGTNVGIGTNVPNGKLHVVSTVAGETVLRTDGTNGTLFSIVDDLSDSLMSVNNSAGLPVLEVFADDRVIAGQYGSGDFVLINNKIGVGTSNPTNKLSVIGAASIGSNSYNVSAPANGLLVEGNVGIGTTNPSDKLHVIGSIRISGGEVVRWDGQGFLDTIGNNDLFFRPNQVSKMTLTAAGRLGVGLNSPATLIGVGDAGSTSAASGITFGGDASANLYRISSSRIKTDGSLEVAIGIISPTITSLSGNIAATGSTLDTKINTTNTNLAATGSTLDTKINALSGYSNSSFATILNLAATGSVLDTKINTTNTNLAATGSVLDTKINTLSGYSNATFATITNLAATGSVLDTKINTLSGYAGNTFLSGVGVSNYVPRWSGTKQLVTGNLYDNGINVGIGTNNPNTKLRVNGSFSHRPSGSSNIQEYKNIVTYNLDNFSNGGYVVKTPFLLGTSYEMAIVHVKGYGYGNSSLYDFKVVFYDYGASSAPVNYSLIDLGNDGTSKYLAKDANGYMQICFGNPTDTSRYYYRFTVDCITTRNVDDYSQGWGMYQTTGANFGFASTGVYPLASPVNFNVATNYVGIGKTNPAVQLDVAGTIRSSTNEIYGFGASDNVSLRAASSVNVLGIYTNNVERLRVDANGYLGIGLAPSTLLSIGGAGSASAASGITFGGDASANLYRSAAGALKIDGSLGIGTSPSHKLHLYGSNIRQTIESSTDSSAIIIGQWDGITNRIESSSRKLFLTSYTSGIAFGINGSENMTLNTAGNLGIGITAPEQKLHIASSAGFTAIKFSNSTNSAGIISYSADNLYLYTANAQRLTIDTNGNVGIGTTVPTGVLTVHSNGTQLRLQTASGPGSYFATISSIYDATHPFTIAVANNSASTSEFFGIYADSGGANNRSVFPNGNVGIGSTIPAYKLDVNGSAGFANGITVNADASSTSYFVGANGSRPIIFQNNTASAYDFGFKFTDLNTFTLVGGNTLANPATDLVSFTYDGKVGIGTTNPVDKLHVIGNTTLVASDATSLGSGTKIRFYRVSDGWEPAQIEQIWKGTNLQGVLAFKTNTDTLGTLTTKMVIDNNGNVGIGTTNPVNKLDIRGYVVSDVNSNAVEGGFFLGNNSHGIRREAGSNNVRLHTNGGDLIFGAAGSGSQQVTLKNGGNLGIGTIIPNTKLSIGVASDSALGSTSDGLSITDGTRNVQLSRNGTGYNYAGVVGSGSMLYSYDRMHIVADTSNPILFHAGGAERVRIDSNGYVGVGTTSFTYGSTNRGLLEVYGSTDALLALRNSTANFYIQKAGNNLAIVNGGAGYMSFNTNGADRLFVNSAGNIGIGLTVPTDKIQISGGGISFTTSTGLAVPMIGIVLPTNVAYIGPYNSPADGNSPTVVAFNQAASVQQTWFYASGRIAMVLNRQGRFHIGDNNNAPPALLNVGPTSSVAATGGMSFGNDASANLYRSAASTIKTDGSLSVAGLIYSNNNGYYSSVSKATTANWGQYTTILGDNSNSNQLIQVTVAGGNVTWNGIFTANATNSYRPTEIWGNVKLLECSTYNCNVDDVVLNIMSTTGTDAYAPVALVLKTNGAVNGGNGTGYANTVTVTLNGQFPSSFALSSNSWTLPYAYLTATSANTKQIYSSEAGRVGIGTSNPVQKFQVEGTAGNPALNGATQAGIVRISNATDNAILDFGIRAGGLGAWIQSTDETSLSTNYPLLLNPNGGNVGIGTTSPSGIFHAANLGTANTTADNFSAYFSSVNRNASIFLLAKNTEGSAFYFGDGDSNTVGALVYEHTANYLRVDVSGSERMRIVSDGKVGIGTISPAELLDIAASADNSAVAGPKVNFKKGATTKAVIGIGGNYLGQATQTDDLIFRNDAGNILFGFAGAEKMRIASNGNVGIATTLPGYSLQIGQNTSGNNTDYSLGILRHGTLSFPSSWTSNPAFKIIDLVDGGPSNVDINGIINLELPRFQASDTNSEKASLFTITYDSALGPLRVDGKGNTWIGYDRTATGINTSTFSSLIYGGLAVGSNYQTTTLSNGQAIFEGNVGVGITNPLVKFVVNGGTVNTATYTSSEARIADGSLHLMKTAAGGIFESIRAMNADTTAGTTVRFLAASTSDPFNNANGGKVFIDAIRTATNMDLAFSLNDVAGAAPVERVRFMGNGNVGIGITTPLQKLQVDGVVGSPASVGVTQSGIFRISNTTDNAVLDFGIRIAGSGAWIQSTDETSLAANYPLLLNPNGGNVGIGTLVPADKLHVIGNIRINGGDILNWGGQAFIQTIGANDMFFRPNSTLRMILTAVGNLGLGVLAPATLLSVGGAGSTSAASGITFGADSQANLYRISSSRIKTDGNFTIDGQGGGATSLVLNRSSTSSENGMTFNTAGVPDWYFYVNDATSNLQIQRPGENDATPRVRFDGSNSNVLFNLGGGNVGVGTDSPNYKLDVIGSVRASGELISEGNNTRLSLFRNNGINYFDWASGQSLYLSTQTSVGGAGRNTLMTVTSGGRVGIGSVNPTDYLDFGAAGRNIVFAYAAYGEILNSAASIIGNNVKASPTGNSQVRRFASTPDAGNFIKLIYNKGVTFHTNITSALNTDISEDANERMRINLSGDVGIGTISPVSRLDVNGAISLSGYLFADRFSFYHRVWEPGGNPAFYLGDNNDPTNYYDNNSHIFRARGAGAERMRITSAGNVGIGTVVASRRIHAYTATGPVMRLESSGSNASIEFAPSLAGNGLYNWLVGAQQNISNAFEITPSTAINGTTYSNPALLITSAGNVGIGTTNPITKFHVYAASNGNNWAAFAGNVGATLPSAYTYGVLIGSNYSNGFSESNIVWGNGISSNQYFAIGRASGSGFYSEQLRIDVNGDVGIGNINPTTLLSVGSAGSTSAASGITFGGDASANLYRISSSRIKTDGSLEAAVGIISPTITSLSGNIAATGSTLDTKINTLSGYSNATFATITNLAATGSVLDTKINTLSGYAGNTFLSGVGVSNYVPRWSGTKQLVTGSIYDNGTDVGISTISPGAKLDVVGAVRMPVIRQSTTLYAGTDIIDDNSTRTVYFNIPEGGNNPARYFKVARIKITSNYHNVSLNGYFTTTNSALHVGFERKVEFDFIAYAATNPGAPQVTYLKRGPDTTNVLVYAVPDGGGAGTTYYDVYIKNGWYNDTNGELAIRVGYSSAVTVWQAGLDSGTSAPVDTLVNPNSNYAFDTAGNVGIGTTNPATLLHVDTAGADARIRVSAGANTVQGGMIANTGTSLVYAGSVTNHGFSLRTNDTDRVRIDTNGNVGIGTASTIGKLDVYDNTDGPLLSYVRNLNAGSNAYTAFVLRRDGGNNGIVLFTNSSTRSTDGGTGNSTIRTDYGNLLLGAGGSQHILTTAGNVGIGTTNPTQRLEVQGNAQIGNDSVTNIGLKITRLNGGIRTSEHTYHSSQNSPWYTYGQNLNWTNELAGTVESTQAYRPYFEAFAPAVGYKTFGFMNVTTGAFTNANMVNSLVLKSDGYVGLGTTNPNYQLTVIGANQATANVTDAGNKGGSILVGSSVNATNQGGSVLFATLNDAGNYTPQSAIKSLFLNGNGYGLGDLAFSSRRATGDTSLTESVRFTYDGKVGIGTNTPTTLLSVGGAGSTLPASGITFGGDASANLYRSAAGTLKTDGRLNIVGDASASTPDLFFNGAGGFGSAGGQVRAFSPNNTTLSWYWDDTQFTYNNFPLRIVDGSSNVLVYFSATANSYVNGGNLGVGTSTPSGKLHVVSTVAGATVLRADGTNGTLFSVVDDLSDSLMSVNNSAGLPVLEVFADDRVVAGQYGSGDFVLVNNKVGIGTSNPINKLSVVGNVSIGSNSYNISAPTNGLIVEGNVGIGTTSPDGKLSVLQSNTYSSFRSNGAGAYTYLSVGRTASELEMGVAGGFNQFFIGTAAGESVIKSLAGKMHLGYASNAPAITINTSNYVGLGTTNPVWSLDVSGTAVRSFASGTIEPGFIVDYASSNGVRKWRIGNVGDTDSTSPALYIWQEGVGARMYFRNNGYVGVGTTIPTHKLEVFNTANSQTYVRINNQNSGTSAYAGVDLQAYGGGWQVRVPASTTFANPLIFSFNESEKARITYDGKVGIGTASPTTLLSVGGPGSTSAASGLTFGGDAEANLYRSAEDTIKTDGSLIVAGNVTATNLISGNGTANYVTKWNGTKSVANSQIFDDGTYVGVNTITNTTYRLQVNGSFAATTKSFDIVHPTISGKRLTYASLEGPENGVYYRGQNNNNEISLPHYWSGLVHDDSITVNLTAVGRRKDGKIRNYSVDQIGHNKVYIYTDSNDNIYNYYYTIFAERKDVSKLVTERDME